MTVESHIICWNEIDIIQLTIDHYKKICDRLIFYDNHSDDGTQDVIIKNGCQLIPFGKHGVLDDNEYLKIKNNCWKKSQADWVIVCDVDEIIWHNDFAEVLKRAKAVDNTVFSTVGFDIFSNHMPKDSYFDIMTGVYSANYSKLAVFSPKIKSINYVWGCHVADPAGNVRYASESLNLFHYRNIGGAQRLINRHELYRKRMSAFNKRLGLGIHYTYNNEQRQKDWQEKHDKAIHFHNNRDL
jgi:glycosyltransferase involved in cell wall biosynthesis